MDTLPETARIYLNDIELIAEAREEFSNVLADWWEEIVVKTVQPKLSDIAGAKIDYWDNKASPGMVDIRAVPNQLMLLKIVDPRHANRPFYTVSLHAGRLNALKAMHRDQDLNNKLEQLASTHKVGVNGKLKWSSTELATQDIETNPEEPKETCKAVCDAAVRFFKLVLAHAKHSNT